MKSIVEEASSLAKAFNQAWERAGKPQECTVKILAEPEKNFIGMTIKSAKLALFFNEPAPVQSKKGSPQPQRRTQPQETQQPRRTQERQPATRTQPERSRQEPRSERVYEQREQRSNELRSNDQRSIDQRARQQQKITERSHEQRSNEQRSNDQREPVAKEVLAQEIVRREVSQPTSAAKPEGSAPRVRPTWSEEMGAGVRTWIQETLQIMGCPDVSFETALSRSILTVTFSKPVIEDTEKERLLFRSWSHLIVQHIKQEFNVHGKELKIILKGSRN